MPRRIFRFFFNDHRLLFRYLGVGAASAAIELSLFSLFYQVVLWPLFVANGAALSVALLFNFTAHRLFTFGVVDLPMHRLRWYALMQVVGVSLNNLLVWLFIKEFEWSPPVAKLTQIGLVFLWTFSFSRLVVFSTRAVGTLR